MTRYVDHGNGNGSPREYFVKHLRGVHAGQVIVKVGLTENSDVLGPHFVNGNLDTRDSLRIVSTMQYEENLETLESIEMMFCGNRMEHCCIPVISKLTICVIDFLASLSVNMATSNGLQNLSTWLFSTSFVETYFDRKSGLFLETGNHRISANCKQLLLGNTELFQDKYQQYLMLFVQLLKDVRDALTPIKVSYKTNKLNSH